MNTPSTLRQDLVETARTLNRSGLNQGTSGNVSVRDGEMVLITPTGVAFDVLTPADLVAIDLDGQVVAGAGKPSSEWRMHTGVYRARPDVQAVVHVHPPHATALACLRHDIPPFHYMVAVAGGATIRCARYATYGTQELADAATAALHERTACLLANHGLLALGATLAKARYVAQEVEVLAQQYLLACQAGQPVLLSKREMARVLERFAHYGQPGAE